MAATCPECPARLSECRTKSEINNSDIGMLHAARFLRRQCGMTAARQILPGRVYMITRRCTQRTFLLRPDPATTQTFLYCLAHAAEQTGVTVLGSVVMSNHHHTIIYDPKDFLSAFMESLHGLVARAMNCLRGRWEHFWDEQQVNAPPLVEVSDVLRMMAYAATNPVRADLVEHAEQWPGLNTAEAFLRGTPLTVERPRHFFRQQGKGCLPERLTLTLGWPESLGPVDAARRALRGLIDEIEGRLRQERVSQRRRVLGRDAVRRMDVEARPATREPRRRLRPTIAAGDSAARVAAILSYRAFREAYRAARDRLLKGLSAVFPPGTYWLRRNAGVAVLE